MDSRVDATDQSTMADDATAFAHGSRNPGQGFGGGLSSEELVLSPVAVDRQVWDGKVVTGHVWQRYR
jgi:hypothetical protein